MTELDPELARMSEELRIVLGRMIRRLRLESPLPIRFTAVLARLEREGTLSTSDLAHRERMRPQSMAETVKELEDEGLIFREPDPKDGRRMLLNLTGPGIATLKEDRARREAWLAGAIAKNLTARERAVLERAMSLLTRLADS